MSRNSKNARLTQQRKQFKRATFSAATGQSTPTGNRGPAQTTPKHNKRRAWFQLFSSHADYTASLKKGAKKREAKEKEDEAVVAAA